MTSPPEELLARARTEVEAARVLLAGGFPAQAVSRAYYAAFYAAEAVLSIRGETRSTHTGVISGFAKYAIREGGLDPNIGSLMRRLLDLRHAADYRRVDVSPDEGRAATDESAVVVEAVERWTAGRA